MSEGGKKILWMSKTELIGTWAAIGGALAFPQAVVNTVDATANLVWGTLSYAGDALWSVAGDVAGSLVTPIATGLSGMHVWNRIADIWGLAEDAALRKYLKWGSAGLGVIAAASPIAPYLVWGAIASKLWKRPFKWATWLAWRTATAVIGWTLWPIKDGVKSIPWNVRGWWNYA